jgi:tRNA (adenine37-N6)-methyltransferase
MKPIPQVHPIGFVHSPFKKANGTPIQPNYAEGTEGTLEILPEYVEGLSDIEGFERIWLIYYFDRASKAKLRVVPFRDDTERGIFATRAPCRPNPIGMSVVRLLEIKGNMIRVGQIDILDRTPLLDIKPYVPQYDSFPSSRAGWVDNVANGQTTADNRFIPPET